MRVLHIINWLATGGAEKLIVETLPLFNNKGDMQADLALLDSSEYQFYKKFKEGSFLPKIHELSKGSVYNPFLIFKIIPLLKKYDVVHVHLFPALYWVGIAKMLSFSKTKLVFTEHSTSNRRLNNPKLRFIDRFIYGFYDKIICISPEVKHQLQDKMKISVDKLKVVTNGINIGRIREAKPHSRTDFGYGDLDMIIVMVAGFRIEKDHETVIEALSALPENFKLLLVGDGYRRTEIEDFIRKINIEKRVKLAGIRSDVYSLLKMSNIAVLSSHWEGFGLAAAEAMAAGIPVIASNVDGLAQVVEDGGILFEKGNVNDLKQKIQNVAADNNLKETLVDMGYKKVFNYDIKQMVNQSIKIYQCLQ